MRTRRLAVTATTVAMVLGPAVVVYASWPASDWGVLATRADAMPAGNEPTLVAVDGAEVTIEWAPSTMSDGAPVDGYEVRRREAGDSGGGDVPGQDCAGLVADTRCTERDTPAGTWEYTVAPRKGDGWRGAPSPPSEPVTTEIPVHVADLDGAVTEAGQGRDRTWSASATITVRRGSGAPAPDVEVDGDWDRPLTPGSTETCVTDETGTCSVRIVDMAWSAGNEVTLTLSPLAGDGYVHTIGEPRLEWITIRRNGQVTCGPDDCPA